MERTRDMVQNLRFLSDDWDLYEDMNGYNMHNPYKDIKILIPRYQSDFLLIDVWCSGEHIGDFRTLFSLDKFVNKLLVHK